MIKHFHLSRFSSNSRLRW